MFAAAAATATAAAAAGRHCHSRSERVVRSSPVGDGILGYVARILIRKRASERRRLLRGVDMESTAVCKAAFLHPGLTVGLDVPANGCNVPGVAGGDLWGGGSCGRVHSCDVHRRAVGGCQSSQRHQPTLRGIHRSTYGWNFNGYRRWRLSTRCEGAIGGTADTTFGGQRLHVDAKRCTSVCREGCEARRPQNDLRSDDSRSNGSSVRSCRWTHAASRVV